MKTKILMLVAAAMISTQAFSQSNEQGTIQIGLGWMATLGGGTVKAEPSGGTSTENDVTGVRGTYGLRAQYGLSDNLSAGIFVRAEAATYIPSTIDIYGAANSITYSGTSFGLEGKYYVANSDKFNFYPALAVGYTTATNSFAGFTLSNEYDVSGINYAVGVGLNWYFVADVFGISFDIDYAGSSLSGTQPADATSSTPEIKYTLTNGSIAWGFGLTAHFGGK